MSNHGVADGTRLARPLGVPSFPHEILVELFRSRAELACEVLRCCASIDLGGDRCEQGSVDLSQIAPTEYRSDAVTIVRDAAGVESAAVIVEIQLAPDPDKLISWPVYVTALRARLRCPVYLLVIAPESSTARWAARPIELGHPGFCLVPIVIGFDDIPVITDLAVARALPELGVLSVLAHPEEAVADAALQAITELPIDRATLYYGVVMNALPELVRQILEARMLENEYVGPYDRKLLDRGREEGREEGLRSAAVELARSKLGSLTSEDESRIAGVPVAALPALVVALGRAMDAVEARAALEAAGPAA
jgi:hypothetical protein